MLSNQGPHLGTSVLEDQWLVSIASVQPTQSQIWTHLNPKFMLFPELLNLFISSKLGMWVSWEQCREEGRRKERINRRNEASRQGKVPAWVGLGLTGCTWLPPLCDLEATELVIRRPLCFWNNISRWIMVRRWPKSLSHEDHIWVLHFSLNLKVCHYPRCHGFASNFTSLPNISGKISTIITPTYQRGSKNHKYKLRWTGKCLIDVN